ncbi:DUF4811 domain-containing protein [Paucilactobacillus suebicus]|uniref:DUF4811 domain-containing protein n=1 Tax=Paucilactobacillus suebicus DSM 5007 = KCTC 3549 TaxID=1423807 RepID=A0A0R1VX85_9LACO|nr:DUF4811 domain-containing protein [Paucilactobacillus suebicus]KRM10202.1 hypothetical protein FD16_GL001405 [Paucilactobacillus suebicus DSM 5007 = KCTC 3549]
MIVILLFIGAIIFAVSMIFMRPSVSKDIWVLIGLILTLGSITLIILNYHSHLGTVEENSTITYPLTSSVKGQKVLIYKQLGTKSERIYLYKTNPLNKKLEKTNPANTIVSVKNNQKTNQLKITKTYRVYPSEELQILFGVASKDHQFVRQHYQFSLKPGWQVKQIK